MKVKNCKILNTLEHVIKSRANVGFFLSALSIEYILLSVDTPRMLRIKDARWDHLSMINAYRMGSLLEVIVGSEWSSPNVEFSVHHQLARNMDKWNMKCP
jgi:hypothetical protein